MNEQMNAAPSAPQEKRKRNTTLIIIVAVVALCCLCAIVGVLAWQYGDTVLQAFGVTY